VVIQRHDYKSREETGKGRPSYKEAGLLRRLIPQVKAWPGQPDGGRDGYRRNTMAAYCRCWGQRRRRLSCSLLTMVFFNLQSRRLEALIFLVSRFFTIYGCNVNVNIFYSPRRAGSFIN
jgi:hypothetical protein